MNWLRKIWLDVVIGWAEGRIERHHNLTDKWVRRAQAAHEKYHQLPNTRRKP